MIIFDGSFLLGVAAVLTSIATLWRTVRGGSPQTSFRRGGSDQQPPLRKIVRFRSQTEEVS